MDPFFKPLPHRFALLALCAVPFLFSVGTIGDPFGQTEEAVNAAIWALGGRNLLELGPFDAHLGALVAPFTGTGGGIYAHHPPLPVWVNAFLQVFSPWEGLPRLFALLCVAFALVGLQRLLELRFKPWVALAGTAVAGLTPFVLIFGRMQTTLTLATPLHAWLVFFVGQKLFVNATWRWPFLVLLSAAVFSSWDGVVSAGVVVVVMSFLEWRDRSTPARLRRIVLPLVVSGLSLLAMVAYLVWANGGPDELIRQASYRSGFSARPFTTTEWLFHEAKDVRNGVGTFGLVVGLLSLVSMVIEGERRVIALVALLSVPALGMTLGMQQGAYFHPFWSYNLWLPIAPCAAWVLFTVIRRTGRLGAVAFLGAALAQLFLNGSRALEERETEHRLNSVGALAQRFHPANANEPVAMFSAYAFHPYVAWYLRDSTDVALSAAEVRDRIQKGAWSSSRLVMADTLFISNLACAQVSGIDHSTRWVVVEASALAAACQSVP